MILHETTSLRRYDAEVLSFTQMNFVLGSAIRLPGTTDQGLTVQLPPLVKTEAIWSVHEDGILPPATSVTVVGFGGKTRSLGESHGPHVPGIWTTDRSTQLCGPWDVAPI